jgi:hypothetical protein
MDLEFVAKEKRNWNSGLCGSRILFGKFGILNMFCLNSYKESLPAATQPGFFAVMVKHKYNLYTFT